ncbi:MAG: hypothetical protein KAW12_08815 [Candidatus Aminicenantes bacterium]|nr:hypothetical protein [Candidatus Aminicenantes bacterium]
MALTKKETIEKILSLTYKELAAWMRDRLCGSDPYFSLYVGYETDLRGFLTKAFVHIEDEEFRKNFIKVLDGLIEELKGYSKQDVKKNKEYIYELLTLCGSIDGFTGRSHSVPALIDMAKGDQFKKVVVYEAELQQVLLNTLATIKIGGINHFWIEQMKDVSNKYYANAAFYALLRNRCSLDLLLEHIHILVDAFKGELELKLAVVSLFDAYEQERLYDGLRNIEAGLTPKQMQALNDAFKKAGYEEVFRLEKEPVAVSIPKTKRRKKFVSRNVNINSFGLGILQAA